MTPELERLLSRKPTQDEWSESIHEVQNETAHESWRNSTDKENMVNCTANEKAGARRATVLATLKEAAKLACPYCETQDHGNQKLKCEGGLYFHDFQISANEYDCKAMRIHQAIAASEARMIPMKTIHDQEIVKVNAPIDRAIVGLVSELNRFPSLYTIESCQGNGETRGAWVCFGVGVGGSSWRDLSDFVLGFFGPGLADLIGDAAHVSINVLPSGLIHGELTIRPGAVEAVTGAIKQLRSRHDPGIGTAVEPESSNT